MESNMLGVYKAEVFTNVTEPTKPVSFFMALTDYVPQATMLLTAALLALFIVISCLVFAERFCPVMEYLFICAIVIRENFWRPEFVRYMNFGLGLTCSFTLYVCAYSGVSWWVFYATLLSHFTFIAFMCRVAWINYHLPEEELEQVFVETARRQQPNFYGEPSQRQSEEQAPRSSIRRPSKPKVY